MYVHNYGKNNETKCKRLYNPQGSPDVTMVYSKMLEFKVYCEQCHEHHLVHNQDPQRIIYVTEDWELAKGPKSHTGELQDPSFRDLLLRAGITASETVHIKFVDIRDGGYTQTT